MIFIFKLNNEQFRGGSGDVGFARGTGDLGSMGMINSRFACVSGGVYWSLQRHEVVIDCVTMSVVCGCVRVCWLCWCSVTVEFVCAPSAVRDEDACVHAFI